MKKRSVPELLAPAGGFRQLRAAVQNGADAVYMGGAQFNARMKADNFDEDELEAATEYAHLRNVKLYVTLNTLIRDDELFKAFSYAYFLYSIGVDGLIIQDLGLGRLLHRYLPEMPIHMSTQGTIYNPQAVPLLKDLGYSRVVPARELSLSEIKAFAAACHSGDVPCQVEVFCHGALCMCYSGQCQLSRMIGGAGGRSGNRGLCAQPCRLPYTDAGGKTSYLLSPKDLCTVEFIPELAKAGVDSLKIEGRLKSPEYVAMVTAIYRKYLDEYTQSGQVRVSEEDRRDLTQIFNRGGFTSGYLFGNPGERLLSGESPKNAGHRIGTVTGSVPGARGKVLMDVKLQKGESVCQGDGVEARGASVTGNVVTYCKELGNRNVRLGDFPNAVRAGDRVYKVTDRALNERARASFANDDARKVGVSFAFTACAGSAPVLQARCGDVTIAVRGDAVPEPAVNRPADEAYVAEQLCRLGGTVYEVRNIRACVDDGLMIPRSALNKMRREAVQALDAARIQRPAARAEALQDAERDILNAQAVNRALDSEIDPERIRRVPIIQYMKERDTCGALPEEETNARVIPYIDAVSKGALDDYLQQNFETIVCAVRESGILVGNLGWIRRLVDAGVPVYGDAGLNVYNRQSRQLLMEVGVEPLFNSLETKKEPDDMVLMVTEHPLPEGVITDRKGAKYNVSRSESGDKYVIRAKI